MTKKLPKTGSSKHPWLTANPITWTSFFGNLKNPAIFQPKNHVIPGRTNRTNKQSSFDCAHGRKERFAQKFNKRRDIHIHEICKRMADLRTSVEFLYPNGVKWIHFQCLRNGM